MQFDSLSEFFAMGGYGFYVWLAFGTTFAAMAILAYSSHKAEKSIHQEILKQSERDLRIRQAQELASK